MSDKIAAKPTEKRQRKTKTTKPVETQEPQETDKKRGRKVKYESAEDKIAARRKQQREYRMRKKEELTKLRQLVKDAEKNSEKASDEESK